MVAEFDVPGRLAQGRPAVDTVAQYVWASHQVGYQHPDLTLHAGQLRDWYDTEDGMNLTALQQDCATFDAAVRAADEALAVQERQLAALPAAWEGVGAQASQDFLQRHGVAAAGVAAAVRTAAEALRRLSEQLWQAVDAKVDAVVAVEADVGAARADWLAASAAVISGVGDRAAAAELVDSAVKPFVDSRIRTDWLSAVQSGGAAVADAYQGATAEIRAGSHARFEIPGDLGPTPPSPMHREIPAPGPAPAPALAAPAPAAAPVAPMPTMPSAWEPPPPPAAAAPLAAPPAPASAAAPVAPMPTMPSAWEPPPPPAAAAPLADPPAPDPMAPAMGAPMPDLGGGGLGSGLGGGGLGSGLGGGALPAVGQRFADALSGLLGGGGTSDAGLEPAELEPPQLDPPEPADKEEPEEDEPEEDEAEEDAADDEDEATDEESEDPPVESVESVEPVEPVEPVETPPPTPPPPPPPAEPLPPLDDERTPCAIAADEVPQVGEPPE
ncbi:hypothetical protein EV589_2952 [Mycobacterium sp. BK558]|nr:hypothetical protein EV589_2952 [Mycobacterium sp. BK558]